MAFNQVNTYIYIHMQPIDYWGCSCSHKIYSLCIQYRTTGSDSEFALAQVRTSIATLEKQFEYLKKQAIKLLQKCKVGVKEVVYELTTLSADEKDEHKGYLEKNCKELKIIGHCLALSTSTGTTSPITY